MTLKKDMQSMRMQTAAMEVPCRRCGALFDLSYDLAQFAQSEEELAIDEIIRALRTLHMDKQGVLCWECRA